MLLLVITGFRRLRRLFCGKNLQKVMYNRIKTRQKRKINRKCPKLTNGTCVFFFGAVFKKWTTNLPLKWAISDLFYPMSAHCVHTETMFVHVSEREIFFSLNFSKIAVECDWNSKVSQNVQNLFFFGKIIEFF